MHEQGGKHIIATFALKADNVISSLCQCIPQIERLIFICYKIILKSLYDQQQYMGCCLRFYANLTISYGEMGLQNANQK